MDMLLYPIKIMEEKKKKIFNLKMRGGGGVDAPTWVEESGKASPRWCHMS